MKLLAHLKILTKIKKPTLLKWVFFFRTRSYYFVKVSATFVVQFFVESQHSFVASSVAFPVPFTLQAVKREIVIKNDKERINNGFHW